MRVLANLNFYHRLIFNLCFHPRAEGRLQLNPSCSILHIRPADEKGRGTIPPPDKQKQSSVAKVSKNEAES